MSTPEEVVSTAEAPGTRDGAPWWLMYSLCVPAAALVGIGVYAWGAWDMLAVAVLVAGGAVVTGGLLGFLFGIPRALTGLSDAAGGADARGRYNPNTNLEQISDWLTKILVGVGLVEFTSIAKHARDLVDALGPALGGDPYGRSFAAATLVVFSVSGFLVFYLVTRIYLPHAFAQADRDMVASVVKQEIAEDRETRREQQKRDVDALTLIMRQLEPEPGAPSIGLEDLKAAVGAASPLARSQIFAHARDQRQRTWENDKDKMERTIPAFRALIESADGQKFHRNHGQLGYALKDQRQPDFPAAEAELTKAIKLRDDDGEHGFLLYEFNRALARIGSHGPSPSPEERAAIEADLAVAAASPFLQRRIAEQNAIIEFRAAA